MRTSIPDLRVAPLAGATVVITRPAGTSAGFVARARALGAGAIVVPGLSLRAAPNAAVVRAQLHAARHAQLWIFTSPAAVRFAFQSAPELIITRPARAACVGPGTARALVKHGIEPLVARVSRDSEGLLALPELADVGGRRIALIKAPGGRDLIAQTLRQRGADVGAIDVYRRVPARLTRRHFDALERARDPLLVLISSAETLANLAASLPQTVLQRLRRQPAIASSARLAAIMRNADFDDVIEAASAMPDDLLEAAARALARHRL